MGKTLYKIAIRGDISYMVKILEYSELHFSKIEELGFIYSEQDECTEELFSIYHGVAVDDSNLEIIVNDSSSHRLVPDEMQMKNEEINLPDGKYILFSEKLSNPVYEFVFDLCEPIQNHEYLTTSLEAINQPRFIDNLKIDNGSKFILSDGVSFDFSDSIGHQIFVIDVIDSKVITNQEIGK